MVQNDEVGVTNQDNAADLAFYAGTNGAIDFAMGATVTALSGNIAFIANSFALNSPSTVSTVSTPGTSSRRPWPRASLVSAAPKPAARPRRSRSAVRTTW
jgi:hypothetical protein